MQARAAAVVAMTKSKRQQGLCETRGCHNRAAYVAICRHMGWELYECADCWYRQRYTYDDGTPVPSHAEQVVPHGKWQVTVEILS